MAHPARAAPATSNARVVFMSTFNARGGRASVPSCYNPLFDDDVRVMADLAPLLVVGAHVGGELRPVHVHDLDAHGPEALSHRLVRRCLAQRRSELLHYRCGRGGGCKYSGEGRRFIALHPELVERRAVGEGGGGVGGGGGGGGGG